MTADSPLVEKVEPKKQRPAMSLLVPLAAVGLFWGAWLGLGFVDIGMFPRFIGRTLILLVLTLVVSGWWLFFSRTPWMVRLGLFVLVIIGGVVAGALCHPTVMPIYCVLWSLPAILTFGPIWLAATPYLSGAFRYGGVAVLIAVCWGGGDLVRMEGMKGDGRPDAYWRWTASSEDDFLADLATNETQPKATDEEAETIVASEGDWAAFRGPTGNSQAAGLTIETDWDQHPPELIWQRNVGPAWTSILVIGDRIFTQEQRGEIENVTSYQADTGKPIWSYEVKGRFEEQLGGVGPRATPAFGAGKIYAMSPTGRLDCLNASTGDLVWSRDLATDYDAEVPVWGFSISPLFFEGQVFVFVGGKKEHAFVALDAETGDTNWKSTVGKESYSSPALLTIDDTPMVVFIGDEKFAAFDPTTGDELWSYEPNSNLTRPSMQPQLVDENKIVLAFSPFGIQKLAIEHEGDAWSVEEVWETKSLKPDYSDFVIHDGFIYGFDPNIFVCVDLATGKRQWKKGRYGTGQVVLLPEQSIMLVITEQGELKIVECNSEKLNELASIQAIEGKTWNHFSIRGDYVFVRNAEEMACWRLPTQSAPE